MKMKETTGKWTFVAIPFKSGLLSYLTSDYCVRYLTESQSLLNQVFFPMEFEVKVAMYVAVAIPFKSGLLSYSFQAVHLAIMPMSQSLLNQVFFPMEVGGQDRNQFRVAIPFKSGLLSYTKSVLKALAAGRRNPF